MPLLDQIQKDMVSAMKAREEARLGALRMIKAALQKHQIDSMKPLDEQTELQLLNMLISSAAKPPTCSARATGPSSPTEKRPS